MQLKRHMISWTGTECVRINALRERIHDRSRGMAHARRALPVEYRCVGVLRGLEIFEVRQSVWMRSLAQQILQNRRNTGTTCTTDTDTTPHDTGNHDNATSCPSYGCTWLIADCQERRSLCMSEGVSDGPDVST
jgi:hypothetical protein